MDLIWCFQCSSWISFDFQFSLLYPCSMLCIGMMFHSAQGPQLCLIPRLYRPWNLFRWEILYHVDIRIFSVQCVFSLVFLIHTSRIHSAFILFFVFSPSENTRRLICRQSQAATSNILGIVPNSFFLGFLYSRNQKANWFGKEKMILLSLILIGKFRKNDLT